MSGGANHMLKLGGSLGLISEVTWEQELEAIKESTSEAWE